MNSIDWESLASFFGAHGKIVAAAIGLLIAIVSLAIAIYRYWYLGQVERLLGQTTKDLQRQKEFYEKGNAALKQAEEALTHQRPQASR